MVSKNQILYVLMNGVLVGMLEKIPQGGLKFAYHPQWLDQAGARPISLSLPLVNQTYFGDVVYNFFDNLLPDNQQIRARIQARFRIPTSQPFDLLAGIGRDCVGAIQLMPGPLPEFERKIKFKPLSEQKIASILRNYRINPLGMGQEEKDFRISIAGAQEKTAFLYHENQWCEPLQETPTTHIFKLPIGFIPHQQMDLSDSCENEWLCSLLAKSYGLPTADCEILHFEDLKVLSVKRFDRRVSRDKSWIMRLPQEDMCQALGVSYNIKYQSDGGPGIKDIMNVLLGSANSIADRDIFYRTQVFFWLLAAIDGHAKNFSLFIEAEGKYRLTPLYDMISAYPLIKKKELEIQKIKMAMALKGKNSHYHWHLLQRRHFLETAKDANFSAERAEIILNEMLEKTDSVIEEVSKNLPLQFPTHISEPIFEGLYKTKQKLTQ
ncbi:type II toxin-antitoxin system HipA family toxin [Fluoribacter dumoffii]|uniref:Serine/threonine-protein kinase HipA n=1 Tax=Fluoribacter dumoffii TaxID=463 RepID=A0A377GBA1_9GAMM|nr:type II toxin-antitoxin system HipA family toxin [Fluoribacter dumoffii]KTC88722.1 HipA protein, DNA binding regulator [Fluoribacter dumoffii NY 23]MCW8385985.1 type II toxin-antitoxin system HipA family toxin [Fluoribacter dumoffii]MCW8419037.1 type II toxin-antitoxin system HipA family toxin [Fluoribacter dumoffii]MCW8453119.1 type II toxin-antitoxin system HipA family toxin [Fluoribacter dumoffii]MCW8459663.1 type II toxin-antitoxin system HipA family toxin [Fluoribacter dumoffii]